MVESSMLWINIEMFPGALLYNARSSIRHAEAFHVMLKLFTTQLSRGQRPGKWRISFKSSLANLF